jgi:hypothetical protein
MEDLGVGLLLGADDNVRMLRRLRCCGGGEGQQEECPAGRLSGHSFSWVNRPELYLVGRRGDGLASPLIAMKLR